MSYYVTVQDNGRVGYLAGPYKRHGDALAMVGPAKKLAQAANRDAIWYAFGTAHVKVPCAKVGLFNDQLR